MVYAPIWKDTYYTANTQTLSYQIVLEDNIIYSGKAVKRPDADRISININKVCRNYLETDFREVIEGEMGSYTPLYYPHPYAYREFVLKNSTGATLETYGFLLCYDYDFNFSAITYTPIELNVRINDTYADGMICPVTRARASSSPARFVETICPTAPSSLYHYTKVACGDVLYYLNARGGWDAFVFDGNTVRTDKMTTYTTDQVFNNTTLDFENNRYISEIKASYALNTSYLTDEQSAKFAKHLVGSNKCYLHKMNEGWIKPVVITDTSVTHQTYATNGRKLSQYRVNVELSQTMIRK